MSGWLKKQLSKVKGMDRMAERWALGAVDLFVSSPPTGLCRPCKPGL
jgi:hypothetical protein